MKTASKPLSLLLALAMVLGLALPALAAEPAASSVNWDDFYIISQSPASVSVRDRADFKLAVEVNIPQGVEVTHQWQYDTSYEGWTPTAKRVITGAAEPELLCTYADLFYPKYVPDNPSDYVHRTANHAKWYSCTIRGVERDAEGREVSQKTLQSDLTLVTVWGSTAFGDVMYDIFVTPLHTTYFWMVVGLSAGLFLPVVFVQNLVGVLKSVSANRSSLK